MRKFTIAAVAAMIALSGQAMAETTAAASKAKVSAAATRTVAAKRATNEQLLGLGLIPSLLIGAAIVTLVVVATDDDDDKVTSP